MRSDIGQFNVLNGKLTVWVNSSRMMNGSTIITVPDFDIPEKTKKVILEDAGTDASITVPLTEFKSVKNTTSGEFEIPWNSWYKKYKPIF